MIARTIGTIAAGLAAAALGAAVGWTAQQWTPSGPVPGVGDGEPVPAAASALLTPVS